MNSNMQADFFQRFQVVILFSHNLFRSPTLGEKENVNVPVGININCMCDHKTISHTLT